MAKKKAVKNQPSMKKINSRSELEQGYVTAKKILHTMVWHLS